MEQHDPSCPMTGRREGLRPQTQTQLQTALKVALGNTRTKTGKLAVLCLGPGTSDEQHK